MRRIIIMLTIVFFAQALFGQESKFKVHAISLDLNLTAMTKKTLNAGMDGTNYNAAFILSYLKNRISLNYLSGDSNGLFDVFPGVIKNYSEFSLLIGREFINYKHLSIEIYGGLGKYKETIYRKHTPYPPVPKKQTFSSYSVPMVLKVDYIFNNNFTLGLNAGHHVNKINSFGTYGLSLGYHFQNSSH
ncbi:MAG TPA: hypothetical protein ENK85_01880 [Saprospiraceae bacterium]|nr:hypothetical protein [Saprospiraceae bacterium]